MKSCFSLVVATLMACLATANAADSTTFSFLKTKSGKVYSNCRVFKTDPDGVIIAHQHGGAKLLFADLTEDSRAILGYDPEKEAAFEKERAEKKKKDREAFQQYRTEVAKVQAAAYAAEARRMEMITVQNIVSGGYGGYGYGGYGYGWDAFGVVGNGYYGNGYNGGYGNAYCSPLRNGYVQRGRYTFSNDDCRPNGNGVVNWGGRTHFAPHAFHAPRSNRVSATPAMGPNTPSLGGGGGGFGGKR